MAPRTTTDSGEVYIPTTTGTLRAPRGKGRIYTFIRGHTRTQSGELLRPDHPLIKAYPDLFMVLDLESDSIRA